jgi:hypothetical protein
MNIVSADIQDDTPVFIADTWRVLPIENAEHEGEHYAAMYGKRKHVLRLYWQTDLIDKRDLWVYRSGNTDWVCVEKNSDFEIKSRGNRTLCPIKNDQSWDLHINDMAEALILILPPRMGVSETNPPARAALKGRRLMLFLRLPLFEEQFSAVLKLVSVENTSDLRKLVGNLNQAYYEDKQARAEAVASRIQPHDSTPRLGPDRTLQSARTAPFKRHCGARSWLV